MMPDPKKTAALVIGIGGPKPPMSDESEMVDNAGEEKAEGDEDVLAGELMSAIQTSDAGAFKDALKSFIKACNYEED